MVLEERPGVPVRICRSHNQNGRKVKKSRAELDLYQQKVISCPYKREYIFGLMQECHSELTDPDKKIWSRLVKRGLVQKHVAAEYAKVNLNRLPPNEAALHHEIRCGPTVHETSSYLKSIRKTNSNDYNHMETFDFFLKYMRSDESLAPSINLSQAYSVPLELLPNITINVPR
ncbi:hypothetical protein Pcinc_000596 [Petrolisthes cinctipes]|uniref:Uncharacterized protein n=1 Tax=Petrolisthes cinctipes TaxID=88211 RepID=A0AAE1L4P8_PETCI|nr:hypothetical protein Pcinc_000596 [Petrolisthes cinctipes]